MKKQEIFEQWFNSGAGIENKPGVNQNDLQYTSENATLFFAEVMMLLDMLGVVEHEDKARIALLAQTIKVSDRPGRYHRDKDSARKYDLMRKTGTPQDINPISKDNLIAVMVLLKIAGDAESRKAMSKALFTSFGTFRNTDKFTLPDNPGTYTTYGFLLPGILPKLLGLLCFPIFVINYFISMSRENISNHMLNLVELYQNKHIPLIGLMFKHYKKSIKAKYGSIANMSKLFFEAPGYMGYKPEQEHPVTILIREVEFMGLL